MDRRQRRIHTLDESLVVGVEVQRSGKEAGEEKNVAKVLQKGGCIAAEFSACEN